jgi:hypothetical protein
MPQVMGETASFQRNALMLFLSFQRKCGTAGSGSRSRGWIESDFRQKPWQSVVDPDQGRIRIRIRINVISLFEHFFKVLSLYLEARILIRIRIKVKGRILIRIRNKMMRIRNTALALESFILYNTNTEHYRY